MKDDVSGFNARAEELLERYAGLVYRLAFARTRRRTQPLEDTGELTAPPPEEGGELDACLDRLFPELRVVVHLYYYEGYSTPGIAGLLGKKESAVRMRLMRARRQLRDFLEEGGNSCV